MTIQEAIQEIYNQHNHITPRLILDAATPADSVLHDRFNWDDGDAAERYRLLQARGLIRSVRILYRKDNEARRVRKYYAAPLLNENGEQTGQTAYQQADDIARMNPIAEGVLKAQMARDIRLMMERYGSFDWFMAALHEALDAGLDVAI